jgi:cob(I)alamin adenosyltransferase
MTTLKEKWNPTRIRCHLTAVQNQLFDIVKSHISDCTCRGCQIKRDNVELLEASSELRNFTELKIVNTT